MTTIRVSIADTHAPFQDPLAVELACKILQELKPDIVTHHGDCIDFYALSPFDRDPLRVALLQEELDSSRDMLAHLKSAAPDAKWELTCDGNHEGRMLRYQMRHPEMFGLEALSITNLLGLSSLGIAFIEPPTSDDNNTIWMHGDRVSKHSAFSAKAMMESTFHQQNILMGHTHRIGTFAIQGPNYPRVGWEIGCLCTLNPGYVRGPNWMQGMAVTAFGDNNQVPGVEQIIFEGRGSYRRCFFRGKEFISK